MLVPVILVGGSGSRLAPISTPDHPKPFIDLLNTGESLFQATITRAQAVTRTKPLIIGSAEHEHLIQSQLAAINADAHLVLEPSARNTAPALAAAALIARSLYNQQVTLLVMPADHYIGDLDYFVSCVRGAQQQAQHNQTLIFGITPTSANTHYGYIQQTESGAFKAFTEKPDQATAEHYLKTKHYLWNSGFFLTTASHALAELQTYAPNILSAVQHAINTTQPNNDLIRVPQRTTKQQRPLWITRS